MKKCIVVVIFLLVAICLFSRCGKGNTKEVKQLRDQVKALQSKVSELEKNAPLSNEVQSVPTNDLKEPANTVNLADVSEKIDADELEVQKLLENTNSLATTQTSSQLEKEETNKNVQNNSVPSNSTNALQIANSYLSSEQDLLAVAKQCASITRSYTSNNEPSAVELATAIVNNANSTDNVMKVLTSSVFPSVWLVTANSSKCSEGTLLILATKCLDIHFYSFNSDNKHTSIEIATAIAGNAHCTDKVMRILTLSGFWEVWQLVASSNISSEITLQLVALKCVNINNYYNSNTNYIATDLATVISKNANSSDTVLKILTQSEFPDVWLVIANCSKSKEATLQLIAKNCATMNFYSFNSDNKAAAIELANSIAKNPNSTNVVMQELVNSSFSEVTSIGNKWIKNH